MHVDLEPSARETDGRADPLLFVDDEVLRQHVKDLAPGRERDCARGVDRAPHVVAGHFAVFARDGDHAAAVEAFDVRAAHAEMDGADFDTGHQFRFLHRLLNRFDRGVEVDDDAALQTLRLGHAEADDVDAALLHELADHRADL